MATAINKQQQQVVPDAELVIDDRSPTAPKDVTRNSEYAARRQQLVKSAERRMAPRFLLGIFVTIFINYIDRTNLAFASVQMNKDLGLSPSVYGLGAGLFFISYALLQLFSNAALDIFGGPKWMAFICVTWGAVAARFAGIENEAGFLALRFLLGMFEAGAFPGCVYYISCFYPRDRTQVPMSIIVFAILVSQCAGAGLAAGFLSMDGLGGLRGWKWLFLIEGLLCVLVSAYWLLFMPRNISSMTFLPAEEREALQDAMDEQAAGEREYGGNTLLAHYWNKVVAALRNPVTLTASAWGFFYLWSYYGVIYWAPMFVNLALDRGTSTSSDVRTIGLTAIPYGVAAIWQVLFSWHSQRTNEKKWHIAGSWAAAGLTMLLLPTAFKSSGAAGFAVFIICTAFVYGAYSLNNSYVVGLMGAERSMGGALVNSLANFGGFVGPYVLGAMYESTGSHFAGMYLMGSALFVTVTILSIYQPKWSARHVAPVKPPAGPAQA